MRRDVLEQVLAQMFAPRITLADIERELRSVLHGRKTDIEIEGMVGRLYGRVFKAAELKYDASGGQWKPNWKEQSL